MPSADSLSDDEPAASAARAELETAVPEAAETLRGLLDAEDERVQIRAAEAILDRAGITKAKKTGGSAAEREVGGMTRDEQLPGGPF